MSKDTLKDCTIKQASFLIDKQIKYYKAILEYTLKEKFLLKKNIDISKISSSLKKKYILFLCIDEMSIEMSNLIDEKNITTDKKIQSKLSILKKLIKKIYDIDEENRCIFKKNLETIQTLLLTTS